MFLGHADLLDWFIHLIYVAMYRFPLYLFHLPLIRSFIYSHSFRISGRSIYNYKTKTNFDIMFILNVVGVGMVFGAVFASAHVDHGFAEDM